MKKILFLISTIYFFASTSFANPITYKDHEKKIKTFYQIKSAVDKIARKDLEESLRRFLFQSRPGRLVNSPGHKGARDFLVKELSALTMPGSKLIQDEFIYDVDSAIQDYREEFQKEIVKNFAPKDPNYQKWLKVTEGMIDVVGKFRGKTGVNYIFEKRGTLRPEEVLVIGANYDTMVNNPQTLLPEIDKPMPGADNNGTGVIVLLNLAKILNGLDLPITVRLVFFDGEEFNYMGSKAYLQKYKEELKKGTFRGFINLLMLGHDSKREDKEGKNNNMSIYIRPNEVGDLNLAGAIINGGKKTWGTIDFRAEANAMNSSSHEMFWKEGLSAVVLTQNWESDFNPRWHTPNDFYETLNLNTWNSSFRFIAGAVLSMVYGVEK